MAMISSLCLRKYSTCWKQTGSCPDASGIGRIETGPMVSRISVASLSSSGDETAGAGDALALPGAETVALASSRSESGVVNGEIPEGAVAWVEGDVPASGTGVDDVRARCLQCQAR